MPGVLCEHCSGLCCRYIALPIDEPDTKEEFDDVRWYLLHGGVSVFVEDGDWYLNIETDCRHLQPDNLCGIYDTRPQICRDYSTETCEYHAGEYGYERHFLTPENLSLTSGKSATGPKTGFTPATNSLRIPTRT